MLICGGGVVDLRLLSVLARRVASARKLAAALLRVERVRWGFLCVGEGGVTGRTVERRGSSDDEEEVVFGRFLEKKERMETMVEAPGATESD